MTVANIYRAEEYWIRQSMHFTREALEKGSLAAGGSPHMLTMVQPRHGSEENPQYVEKKGEIDLEADIKQNEIMDRAKEKRKRDKDRIETSQEPPLDGVTGAMANAVDNPIGLGLMEKTEFGINYRF